MIDLIRCLLGEINSVKALSGAIDWKRSDPSVNAHLKIGGKSAFLVTGDEREFSVFELEMLFQKGRIALKDFGERLVIEKAIADPALKGYRMLKSAGEKKTALRKNMLLAIVNLADALEGKAPLLCLAGEALKTQVVCQRILDDYKKGRG